MQNAVLVEATRLRFKGLDFFVQVFFQLVGIEIIFVERGHLRETRTGMMDELIAY